MPVEKITIVGLGLIGGSLGKALKKRHPRFTITGIDMKKEIIQDALKQGIIDRGTVDMEEGISDAQLVFLAVPLQVMQEVCRWMIPFLKEGAIVTDVASTKDNVVKMMKDILPLSVHFVGGHPMAGSEKWGLEGASEILFENAAYILTPTSDSSDKAVEKVRNVVECLGARVMFLSPEEHDRKVAAVSHLPHLVACALVNTVGELETEETGYFSLAAGGFRDTTRIAASNSEMWCEILLKNEKAVLPLIKEFKNSLAKFERAIKKKSSRTLMMKLVQARLLRNKVPTGMKSILPQLFELTVTVPDRPGMIGEISSLLGKYKINIIDIEIQRVREDDEGVIRLGFTEDPARAKAVKVLEKHGFNVHNPGL